jgi:hypothetical protein
MQNEEIHPLGQALARSAIRPTAGRGFLPSIFINDLIWDLANFFDNGGVVDIVNTSWIDVEI